MILSALCSDFGMIFSVLSQIERGSHGDPAGETDRSALRLDSDRRLMIRFRGSAMTSDSGLLAYRALDDVLALTTTGGEILADAR